MSTTLPKVVIGRVHSGAMSCQGYLRSKRRTIDPALLSELLLLIALPVLWVWRWRNAGGWSAYLGAIFLLMLLQHLVSWWLSARGFNNHGLANIYMVFEYGLWIGMARHLAGRSIDRSVLLLLLLVFLLVQVFFMLQDFWTFATAPYLLGALVVVLAHTYLLVRHVDRAEGNLLRDPLFLVMLSVVMYYGCSAPIMGSLTYLTSLDMEFADSLYGVNDVLLLLRCVLVGVALLLPDTRSVA